MWRVGNETANHVNHLNHFLRLETIKYQFISYRNRELLGLARGSPNHSLVNRHMACIGFGDSYTYEDTHALKAMLISLEGK